MRFQLLVALRFLRDGKGQTAFILLGIAVGVAVQVFLGTLISGLQQDLIDTTVGSSPHLTVRADRGDSGLREPPPTREVSGVRTVEGTFDRYDEPLTDWREIVSFLDTHAALTAVSPVAQGSGFVVRGSERWPVVIRGVEARRASSIYKLEAALVAGELDLEGNRLLMGSKLAAEARLRPGDNVTVELPGGIRQSLAVAGVFDLGSQALNETWLFVDSSRTRRLLGMGDDMSRIEIQIRDVFTARSLGADLERRLSGVRIENWKDQNSELLTGLQAQSSSSITIQAFVLLAVTLGIASVLAVSVVQKSKQLGILKAMGAGSRSVSRIFLFQGGLLGLFGSVLGSGLGYGITRLFMWGTSQPTGEPLFPLEFSLGYAAAIVLIATTASVVSAFFPARKSARLNPIDVIRG